MTNGFSKFIFICLVISLLTPLSSEVSAQTPDTNNASSSSIEADSWFKKEKIFGRVEVGDFVVGPGRTELSLQPGETIVQEVTVTNRISDNRTFRLEVEDITGSDDGSSAVSLTGDRIGPYSIRDYISFPEDSFELRLGERARIPITVKVPEDAAPGGYYGSVLVSTVQTPAAGESSNSRSPIIARVGSLFFVTVEGDIKREGQTLNISTIGNKSWYKSGPIDLGILYENTGSVHVNPYGEISVTNMFGEEVGFVELEPWFVLPTSLRLREITWDREFLFGRYVAKAKINRGYDNIVDEVSVSFWVMPWKLMVGGFVGLFLFIFVIRFLLKNFEFKRKT